MLTMPSTNRARKAVTIVLALVFGFVSLGFSPAYAIDERVIDVVEVTWPGAAAPAGNAQLLQKLSTPRLMQIGRSSQHFLETLKIG